MFSSAVDSGEAFRRLPAPKTATSNELTLQISTLCCLLDSLGDKIFIVFCFFCVKTRTLGASGEHALRKIWPHGFPLNFSETLDGDADVSSEARLPIENTSPSGEGQVVIPVAVLVPRSAASSHSDGGQQLDGCRGTQAALRSGRVSLPRLLGNSSRFEGSVRRLYVGSGAASAFQRILGASTGSSVAGLSDGPTLMTGSP